MALAPRYCPFPLSGTSPGRSAGYRMYPHPANQGWLKAGWTKPSMALAPRYCPSWTLGTIHPCISPLPESNWRPTHYECVALPAELRGQGRVGGSTTVCRETELNRRHGDFQSPALPTELSRPFAYIQSMQNDSCGQEKVKKSRISSGVFSGEQSPPKLIHLSLPPPRLPPAMAWSEVVPQKISADFV